MKARQIALGGMLTAAAVVVLSLGSVIPVNTYISPVICILLTKPVLERCGKTIGWCYYLAVTLLGLLLAPDREAALVYALMGWYPMVRRHFDRLGPLKVPVKLLFFTVMGALSLLAAAWLLGIPLEGWLLGVVTLLMWDILFLLVDRLLGK